MPLSSTLGYVSRFNFGFLLLLYKPIFKRLQHWIRNRPNRMPTLIFKKRTKAEPSSQLDNRVLRVVLFADAVPPTRLRRRRPSNNTRRRSAGPMLGRSHSISPTTDSPQLGESHPALWPSEISPFCVDPTSKTKYQFLSIGRTL